MGEEEEEEDDEDNEDDEQEEEEGTILKNLLFLSTFCLFLSKMLIKIKLNNSLNGMDDKYSNIKIISMR